MKKVRLDLTEYEAKSLINVLKYERETLAEFVFDYDDDTFIDEYHTVEKVLHQLMHICEVVR